MERQNNIKGGANYFKTKKERYEVLRTYQRNLSALLKSGFNPYDIEIERDLSVREAIIMAMDIKKKQWSEVSITSANHHIGIFLKYLEKKYLDKINIKYFKKKDIVGFLNQLNLSNKSINNYRTTISSIFSQLVENDIIEYNFVASIPALKVKPNRNRPFTSQQIEEIQKYLKKNDPYLLQYLHGRNYRWCLGSGCWRG